MASENSKLSLLKSETPGRTVHQSPSLQMKKQSSKQKQQTSQSKQSNVNNGSQKKTTSSPPTPSQASLESKGSPADGGILKSLKDLEWDLSELFSEKMPNLVELGCSVGCPDELHRQLINLNQRLLEKLKATAKELETRTDSLISEKLTLENQAQSLLEQKLEMEDKYDSAIEECVQLRENRLQLQDEIARLRLEKVKENSDLKTKPNKSFDAVAFGFGAIDLRSSMEEEVDPFDDQARWSSNEDLPALAPANQFSVASDPSVGTRLSELAYREEVRQLQRLKELEESKKQENLIIKDLRIEVSALKKWKETAILETVDKDRLLTDMEQQLVDLQKEYDESKEECLGHQKVIQELKSSLEQTSQSRVGLEPMIPVANIWSSGSRPSTRSELQGPIFGEKIDFKSCFARTFDVNGPDRISWLEQELLRARQRLIQTEADLERLHQSHWALLEEYGRLQEDFKSLHQSIKAGGTAQNHQAISDRLERDVSVLQETVSLLKEELRSKDSLIDDLHRQCESYESKFEVLQNVDYIHNLQREIKERENQVQILSETIDKMRSTMNPSGYSS